MRMSKSFGVSSNEHQADEKLVVFFISPISSHLYSSMGLARRLQTMGWAVEYWGEPRVQEIVLEQGFDYRRIEGAWPRWNPEISLPSAPLLHPIQSLKKIRARRAWLSKMPHALLAFQTSLKSALEKRKPRLVVFNSFRLAYFPFFQREGISCVAITGKPLATWDPAVPPHTSSLVPKKTRLGRAAIWLCWKWILGVSTCRRAMKRVAAMIGIYTYHALVTEIGRQSGIDTTSAIVDRGLWYDLHFRTVPEWALWVPEIDLPRLLPLPDNICFIGTCVDFSRREHYLEIQRKPSTRHFIYVATGVTIIYRALDIEFLRKTVAAFADLPNTEVLISTGDAEVARVFCDVPSNFKVVGLAPQLQVLRIADLTITHGGSNTFRECLMNVVPMLAYPREYDQTGNSVRIVHLGVGLRGSRRRDSPVTIRNKAFQILEDPGFRKRLQSLRIRVEEVEDHYLRDALERSVSVQERENRFRAARERKLPFGFQCER